MTGIARKKIMVSASSKFGKSRLSRIIPLSEMDQVIIDQYLDRENQQALRGCGRT